MQSLYPNQPKALVPVNGKPFIERQIEWLRRGGITDIHLAAGFMGEQIEDWAARRNNITVAREPEPRGTGGALKYSESRIRTDPFLVVNGDTILPNLDFWNWPPSPQAFSAAAGSEKPVGTLTAHDSAQTRCEWEVVIAVVESENADRYGTVDFDPNGRVTSFREKTDTATGWINGGVYVMKKKVVQTLPPEQHSNLETDIFPALIAGNRLYARVTKPPLFDMGTPDGLKRLGEYFAGI